MAGISVGDMIAVSEAPGLFYFGDAGGCGAFEELPGLDSFPLTEANSSFKVVVAATLQVTFTIR